MTPIERNQIREFVAEARKHLTPPNGKPGKKERHALQWIAKIAEVAG